MPSPPEKLVDGLVRRLRSVNGARIKIEGLYEKRKVNLKDVEIIYAGLFTNSMISVEAFLEELFFGLITGQVKRHKSFPRADFKQRAIATKFVLGNDKYIEWLPYNRTKDRAEIFFRKGRPFSELPGDIQDRLKCASLIRNALVHSSQYAQTQFEKHVLGDKPLAPRERRPVGFLRSVFRIAPPQQRFENYLSAFIDTAKFLSSKS